VTVYLQAALLSVTMLPTPVGKHESLFPSAYSEGSRNIQRDRIRTG